MIDNKLREIEEIHYLYKDCGVFFNLFDINKIRDFSKCRFDENIKYSQELIVAFGLLFILSSSVCLIILSIISNFVIDNLAIILMFLISFICLISSRMFFIKKLFYKIMRDNKYKLCFSIEQNNITSFLKDFFKVKKIINNGHQFLLYPYLHNCYVRQCSNIDLDNFNKKQSLKLFGLYDEHIIDKDKVVHIDKILMTYKFSSSTEIIKLINELKLLSLDELLSISDQLKLKQDFRDKNIDLLIKHNLKQNKINEDDVLQLLELKNSKNSKESKSLNVSFDSFEFNRNFQLFNLEKQLEDNLIEHKL
jgi:hypothetical protein